ncbi:MAG TPA: rhodanese-like domain-containing protein [Flavisolibacter sp.]
MPTGLSRECLAIEELKTLLHETPGSVVIIDVRNPEEFQERHIPGAINIPLYELDSAPIEHFKNKMIVTTCGKGGGRSAHGAAILQQKGFKAIDLCNGSMGWFHMLDENTTPAL